VGCFEAARWRRSRGNKHICGLFCMHPVDLDDLLDHTRGALQHDDLPENF
jgi:hypothetical protein